VVIYGTGIGCLYWLYSVPAHELRLAQSPTLAAVNIWFVAAINAFSTGCDVSVVLWCSLLVAR